MAYITDQEIARQQAESLGRLLAAQEKAKAILEAQEPQSSRKKPRTKGVKRMDQNKLEKVE
jgi:hypothetical protein